MFRLRSLLIVSLLLLAATSLEAQRLYVFDCGRIKAMGVETYGFKEGEVKSRDFFVPCYLVVHPRGTLMWDVGVIDGFLKKTGAQMWIEHDLETNLKLKMAPGFYE